MTTAQRRRPAGASAGGQFASWERREANVQLTPASEAFGDRESVPDSAYAAALDEILTD